MDVMQYIKPELMLVIPICALPGLEDSKKDKKTE